MNIHRAHFLNNQSGNALIVILMGIVLFSALSFAIGNMLRGDANTNVISEQTTQLKVDAILDYTRALRQAVQALKISGCDESDISFTVTGSDGYEHTPPAPDRCKVFHLSGGGMNYVAPPIEGLEWFFGTFAEVRDIGTTCTNSSCAELFVYLILNDDQQSICHALNEKLGVPLNISAGAIPNGIAASAKFTGTYIRTTRIGQGAVGANALRGKYAGCMTQTLAPATVTYVFYQVLLAR